MVFRLVVLRVLFRCDDLGCGLLVGVDWFIGLG